MSSPAPWESTSRWWNNRAFRSKLVDGVGWSLTRLFRQICLFLAWMHHLLPHLSNSALIMRDMKH